MPDTGAPWNIPFLDGTELVRAYPDFSEDLADAVADGLSAAGGLVAVKSAIFTGTQTASLAASASVAITNLSITHTLSDASNKLIISVYVGTAGNSDGRAQFGVSPAVDGTVFAVGDAEGSRPRVTVGGRVEASGVLTVLSRAFTVVYAPDDTLSHTYTVRATNLDSVTKTVFVNRTAEDSNNNGRPRATSGLVIQEVKV